MKKISIAIATYNHEKFIERSIESSLSQNYLKKEIIVVDAGSSDNTVALIEKKFKKYVTLIKLKNSAPSNTLNVAINKCKGDYIALLSGDDANLPDRLKESSYYLDNNNLDVAFSLPKIINKKGNEVFNMIFLKDPLLQLFSSKDIFLKLFYRGNLFCAPTALIKAKKIKKMNLFDNRFVQLQDYDLWLRMALNNWKFGFQDLQLVEYRVHDKNLSRRETHGKMVAEIPIVLYKILSTSNKQLNKIFSKQITHKNKEKNKLNEFEKHLILYAHQNNEVRKFSKWKLFETFSEQDLENYGFEDFNIAKYLNSI